MTSQELIDELISETKLPKKVENSIVLALGGYQGSGKTTVIKLLKDDLNLIVISPDRTRHVLIENKHAVDDDFRRMVDETTLALFKYFYKMKYSIVIDNNITPPRMTEIQNILAANNSNTHRLVSVYFETSTEELVKRINCRGSEPDLYKGTVEELYASIVKYGQIDMSGYDLVLNTQDLTADAIAEKITELV